MDTTFSIIIPAYNEEEIIEKSYNTLVETMNKTKDKYELIFINDGSRDKTLEILKNIASKDKNVKVINFSRNFGQQKAITAGIENCTGKAAVIIDADLQDPPYVILEMIKKWREGYDMVYGQRSSRDGETFFKKLTSKMFYRFINLLSEIKLPIDTGDFRLIDRKIIEEFKKMKEQKKYIRGYFTWVGYKSTNVLFHREARTAGETKYNLKAMLKLAFDGIFSFSSKPLKFPFVMGILTMIFTFISFIVNIIRVDIIGIRFALLGFLIGIMFVSNGITNKYVEMIGDNVKERPSYIVEEFINFDDK